MTDHTHAIAAEIVALINASPRTPRVDEIAAIITRPAAPVFAAEDTLAQEWERAVAAEADACARHAGMDDAAGDRLHDRVRDATLAIWRRGARSGDLALFARVARYWKWDEHDPELDADFKAHLALSPYGLDEQSLAQLVNATLKLTGQPHVGTPKKDEPSE